MNGLNYEAMSSRHYSSRGGSQRSQAKKFRWIELTRKGKRWLKKLLIAIVVVLALAVALSYVFITQEPEPDNLKVPDKGLHSIF